MIDINKPVTNPKLLNYIARLEREGTKEAEKTFISEMQSATFLAPAIVSTKPLSIGQVVLEDDTPVSMYSLENKSDERFLMAFTDWEELRKWSKEDNKQAVVLKYNDYARLLLKQDASWDGFVINPYGANIVIRKDMLQAINNQNTEIQKGSAISIGVPSEYPHQLVKAVSSYLKKRSQVRSAYLVQMVQNEQVSILLIIDVKGDSNSVFKGVGKAIKTYLKKDQLLDMVPMDSSLGKQAVHGQQPFYVKK